MKKYISYLSLFTLAIIIIASCKKDDVGAPGSLSINPVKALPGTFVTITGINLQDIVSIKFDTATASFTSVFNTSTAVFTNVPDNAHYGLQTVTITNRKGQTASVSFTVAQPAPTITAVSPTQAPIGDTITLTGTNFKNIHTVLLGSVPVIITDTSSTTKLKFKIPATAVSGTIFVTTDGGTANTQTAFTVGERALLIADFDGGGKLAANTAWSGGGDVPTPTFVAANPAPVSGFFMKASPTTTTGGYALVQSSIGSPFGISSPLATTNLKFDANSNGKTGTQITMIVVGGTNNAADSNFASATIPLTATGWTTFSLPLSSFRSNYGGGALTPTLSNITAIKIQFQNYNGTPSEANIDNIRFQY